MVDKNEGVNPRGGQPDNQINVSTKKNPNFYVFLGKKLLETHDTV